MSAAVDERFVVFDCEGERCVGVLATPAAPPSARDLGVVIIVGGPQYRAGSHRQFVLLARALAAAGVPALRYDYRGMGDSEGDPRSFDEVGADVAQGIATLCRETGVARVVLWGLCDGASAALMHAARDPRIVGIVAVNPWVRTEQGEAAVRLRHYYLKRLFSAEFWRKVLRGGFDPTRAAREVAGAVGHATSGDAAARAPFLQRMEEGWKAFDGDLLVVLSGNDLTAREFEAWVARDGARKALLGHARCERAAFDVADHTFSRRTWRDAAAARTVAWLARFDRAPSAAPRT